jgi:hypothetical protein
LGVADVIKPSFDALSDDPEMECAMVDANIIKVHRHGDRGKRGTKSQAMGKSNGGLTTKILAQGSPRQFYCRGNATPRPAPR